MPCVGSVHRKIRKRSNQPIAERQAIHWFRQDLRLVDNPALSAAADWGQVLPVYILDEVNAGPWVPGAASRCWLHHSLLALNESLGGHLQVFAGDPRTILIELIETHQISAVFWNRCYEPWQTERDADIKQSLQQADVHAESHNGSLLWEPWQALKADGTPYRVFTPYFKNCRAASNQPREPLGLPDLKCLGQRTDETDIAALALLPEVRWDQGLLEDWSVGEEAANTVLAEFLRERIKGYASARDIPAAEGVSRLSPHLHFGEISPNTAWHAALRAGDNSDVDRFVTQLGWRDFSHLQLYHFPELPDQCLQDKFEKFPWWSESEHLEHWQQGQTGYPIVDAGMRELWQTGYMHNRVRMIVASFLVKNLLVDWRVGERWFWDCLVDADLANNSASWQWVAGCGADAAPYFRIFNPVTQGEKFDGDGAYTRQYVPELSQLPDKYLHRPYDAPDDVLQAANVKLGVDYPRPIVDLKTTRQRALDALASTKTD